MKRILSIWCLCIPWYAFAVTNTVSSLPNTNTLADTNLFMVVVGSGANKTNMNTSWAQLKALLPRISSSAGTGTNITLAGSTWIGASHYFGFDDKGNYVNFSWWDSGNTNRVFTVDTAEEVTFENRPVLSSTAHTIGPMNLLEASAITNAVKNSVTVAAGTGTTVNTNTVGNATVYTVNSTATGSSPTTTNGDLIVRGTSADERLPVGPDGSTLNVTDGMPFWMDESLGYYINDSFSAAASIYGAVVGAVSGGQSSISTVMVPSLNDGTIGCWEGSVYNTNASMSGYIRWASASGATNFVAGTNLYLDTKLCLFTVAGFTDTNSGPAINIWTNQHLLVGLASVTGKESSVANGFGFLLAGNGQSQSNVVTFTKSASVITTNATAWVLTTNKWYRFTIRGSTNSMKFYIDRNLVATHTAADNMPCGAGLMPIIYFASSGANLSFTNRYRIAVDYFKLIER